MKSINRYKKGKRCQKAVLSALFALSVLIAPLFMAMGYSGYNKKLPDHGENFSCSTCHCSNELNEFGVDFQSNDKKYNSTLAGRDSDGDGFTNEEEFNADPPTNPGDNYSYPGGNSSGNSTGNSTDTSAYLGPIDMKEFVALFYAIIIPLVIGVMICLVIAEGFTVARQKLRSKKQKDKENGKKNGEK